jgi:uncharacterized LabA/DUF88 family protein
MTITVVPQPRPARPVEFQRAMVFIDGTNLFHRLAALSLKLRDDGLSQLCASCAGDRQIVRTYIYTSQPHLEKAVTMHGDQFIAGTRVVLGDAIATGDGNFKEKGVDALLVADLIYHAAVKNFDYAVLVSVDTDFVRALTRVEDFGCRTAVVAVAAEIPNRLREVADDVHIVTADKMRSKAWVWST